jgi:endonuclease/exonuclease/phosphatase (EEP) superfamily protein YafD
MQPVSTIILLVFVSALGVASLLGFFGSAFWMFDLLAHFRLQYALAAALLLVVTFALKHSRIALVAGGLFLVNGLVIAPAYLRDSSPSDAMLVIALANVNSANTDFAAVANYVRGSDIVVLLEVNAVWESEMRARLPEYPYTVFETRSDNFGLGVLMKTPPLTHSIETLVPEGPPTIAIGLRLRGRTTSLFATHPVPPISASATTQRDAQLAALAARVAATSNDVIVIGDLNATPWSSALTPLFDAGLHDTRRGYEATWPTGMWPLRIPIDLCLVSARFETASHRVGPDVGSDHFPIKVALKLFE